MSVILRLGQSAKNRQPSLSTVEDCLSNGSSYTGRFCETFAHLPGGEEGNIKTSHILLGNAGAIIGKGGPNRIPCLFHVNSQSASLMCLKHEEFGIDNNVEEYLLQLGAVPHDLRQVREANERTNFSYE